MTNYKIIKDPAALQRFIDWLPDLDKNETFYCTLLARKKYAPELLRIRDDKMSLKRFTSDKERLYSKIMQLECPLGAYQVDDEIVPQQALVLYMNPNPRSNMVAMRSALRSIADTIISGKEGFNFHQDMMSEVQRAKSKTRRVDFDFDDVSYQSIADEIKGVANREAYEVLVTRGGFHLMVNPKEIDQELAKSWYNNIIGLQRKHSSDRNNRGDTMIPVPGCVQGDFVPYFLDNQ